MKRLGQWIVRFRAWILVATAVALGVAGFFFPRLHIDSSSRSLLYVDRQVQETFERYEARWGSDRFVVVAIEFDREDIFIPERLRFLHRLTERLQSLSGVERAESLTHTTMLAADGDALLVGPMVPWPLPGDLSEIRRRVMASPLIRRVLIDDTGRMTAVNLRLRYSDRDPTVVLAAVQQVKREVARMSPPNGGAARLAGGPIVVDAIFKITQRDLWILSLAPLLLVGLLLLVMLRSVRGVVLSLSSVLATAVVTFGAMAGSGHAINLVTSMLPSLVMVIGVADVVHVLVEHRAAVAASSGRHEAVVETLRQVGLPCLLTSLTTAVGFGSLMLSDIPQVREFGMFAALGVLLAFLIAVIGLPALLAVLPPGRLSRPLSTAGEGRLVLLLARIDRLFPRARLPVLLTAGLVTLAGGLGLRHLRVESSALTFLPAEHSVLRDLNVVYPRLMGTTPVIVHWWDRGKGQERLRDPKILHAMDRVARAMAGVPGVRKVISITEYLKETNRVIHGGEAGQFVLPRDRRTVATYLELIEGQDPDALSAMINWDRSAANLTLMCVAHNSRAMQTILAALDRVLHSPKIARAMEDGDIVAEVTGLGPLLASVADRIVAGQLTSCFWALGIIALMFFMILWSVRVGLVALLPNVLPILFIVGLMGWLGITLNVFTVMIASIALGIAVDDTIHVLVRTRQEVRQSGDLRSAVSRTLASSGQAIVITTLVVGGGFLVMLLSVMIPAHHFGAMTALTLVMALLADLLLLPLLILWMRPWRGR